MLTRMNRARLALRLRYALALVLALLSSSPAQAEPHAQGSQAVYPARALGPRISPADATRLRALEADLNLLGARSDGRIVDATLSLVVGGVAVTTGVFFKDAAVRSLLWIGGSVSVMHGVVGLTLRPDAGRAASTFTHLPMRSDAEVRTRIAEGRRSLAELARRERTVRLVDGSLTMAAAASYLPVYSLLRRRDDGAWHFGDSTADYVVAVGASLVFVGGVLTAVLRTEAERRHRSYERLDAQLGSVTLRLHPYAQPEAFGVLAQLGY
jgi:hypothetical protein